MSKQGCKALLKSEQPGGNADGLDGSCTRGIPMEREDVGGGNHGTKKKKGKLLYWKASPRL